LSTIILYILFVFLILIDIYFYIDNLYFDSNSKYQQNKRLNHIYTESGYKYDLYQRSAVIDVPNLIKIEICANVNNKDITEIDINREVNCDQFIIGKNIKFINKLNLICSSVVSYSDEFRVENGIIFDKFSNIVVIFKEKERNELIELAEKYSVRRDALRYFTNAKYYQFVLYKGLYDIRYSKPYYDKNENLWAIVPEKVNQNVISSISINFSLVDFLLIGPAIERIIIEKASNYKEIIIDKENKYLTIFKDSLYDKVNECYINDKFNTFNKVGTKNKIGFKPKYIKLNHKLINYEKNVTYSFTCKQFANSDK